MSNPKVLIIGGGFGGVFTAHQLVKRARGSIDVELINADNYFVFQPLLPEVAAGVISAADAVVPLRTMLKGAQVHQAEVIGIDPKNKRVDFVQGAGKLDNFTHYDHLVLAMGQSVAVDRIKGMAEHGLTMKNLQDAFVLRNHVLNCLELADVTTRPELKKRYLTFVIVGGGFSGVETAGEVEELVTRSLKYYPNISKEEVRFILVEFESRLLGEMPEELASYAQTSLEKRGIEIRLNTALESVTAGDVTLSGGEIVAASTAVATVGNGPSPLLADLPITLERGKVPVSRTLAVPELNNVWALGDAALIPLDETRTKFAPPTAQFAVREARVLARNIHAQINSKPLQPFVYTSKGALASIGVHKGVAELLGITVKGIAAWILWRSYYLSFLPGIATKIRVMTNWLLDSLIARNTVYIRKPKSSGTRVAYYRKGETLFSGGMHFDGLYVLLEGKVAVEIDGNVRIVEPGEYFGEKTMLAGIRARGVSRTMEDSKILILNRKDFLALYDALPFLAERFKGA